MEEKILYISLALLLITSGAPASAQNSAGAETVVSVAEGAPLTVECPLRLEARAEWRLEGGAPPADMRAAGERAADGRLVARLSAPAAAARHAGRYTCSAGPAAPQVRVLLLPPGETASEVAPAAAEDGAADADADADVLYYDINRNLTLNCSLASDDKSLAYVWKKNDVVVEKVPELAGRHRLEAGGAVLAVAGRASEDDYGNYSCALGGARRAWDVRGRPVVRLPDNANVVEGQKLKLVCKVVGKPYPAVTWTYNASAEGAGGAPLEAGARGGRVRLEASEQGVPGGALLLEAAERADAGRYGCRAGAAADSALLRVKDMYAALWPFLGICAEVLVLCAVILVYERRRTKPELDDSDTDNHDQKKS